jgi:hypothetical protein
MIWGMLNLVGILHLSISMAFWLISVHHFTSMSGYMSVIGICTLNGITSMVQEPLSWKIPEYWRSSYLHIGFCQIARRICLTSHLKTLACSVVHPILDENEQPPLLNDYVDLPLSNILHLSGHVAPTCLLTIMEDIETLESMSPASFAHCFY